jgi:hypothetical protein
VNTSIVDAATTAAIITWVVSVAKPFVEQLPFARVGAPTHDATLQLGQLAANLLTVFALAAVGGTLTGQNVVPLLVQGFAQAAGAEVLYKTLTRSGGSVNANGALGTVMALGPIQAPQPTPTAAAQPSPDETPTLQMRAVATPASGPSGL